MAGKPKVAPINAFTVEWWDVERPKDYPLNARKWKPAAVAKVADSLKRYGWRQPIVVDDAGVIVIGYLRRAAAREAGLGQVPVHIAAGLSPEAVRGLRLADNRTHDEAEWDMELLAREFGELKALDFDLGATAFSLREIDSLTLKPDPHEDDVPPVQDEPVTKPGDLWVMGGHRLLCGDSTRQEDVERVLWGVQPKPFLMVTDPPYGVSYDSDWRLRAGVNKPWQVLADGAVTNDDNADWGKSWNLFPGVVAYVWHSAIHSPEVAASLIREKFDIRSQIIWAKPSLVIGRGHYHWQHEPRWYASRSSSKWAGDRKQSTVWQIANMHASQGQVDDGKNVHSTQKPVECMRRPMQNHESEVIYDPFLGSGTTLIAAESINRRCVGLELEPKYCDVIVKRWENLTGKKAELCRT